MSISQFKEVVDFVQNHHSFAKWKSEEERKKEVELYPKLPEYGHNIKYIDCCYDSRTADVWMVKLGVLSTLLFLQTHLLEYLIKKNQKTFHLTLCLIG